MSRAVADLETRQRTIYALLDEQGGTLYIGATTDLRRRLREHRARAVWWTFVHTVETVATRSTLVDALELEAYLIHSCHPRFNIQHAISANASRQHRILARHGFTQETWLEALHV